MSGNNLKHELLDVKKYVVFVVTLLGEYCDWLTRRNNGLRYSNFSKVRIQV